MQDPNNQNRDWRRLSRAERAARIGTEENQSRSIIGKIVNTLSRYSNPILIAGVFSIILGLIILLFIDTLMPYALTLIGLGAIFLILMGTCLLYTSPSPRD